MDAGGVSRSWEGGAGGECRLLVHGTNSSGAVKVKRDSCPCSSSCVSICISVPVMQGT